MTKIYEFLALFLLGVGVTGSLSFLIRITEKLHRAGIAMVILLFIILVLLIVLDDAIKNHLNTNYYTYILYVVAFALIILAGSVIQWL